MSDSAFDREHQKVISGVQKRKEGDDLFNEVITYIKQARNNILTFFSSKTDLISISDSKGSPTEELLSERLENTELLLSALIQTLPWETLTAEKSGYLGSMQNKYGIAYNDLETENIYWLLLQNGAVIEYDYHGERLKPEAKLIFSKFPEGYTLCGYQNSTVPYSTGYIYYATNAIVTGCPSIKIIKKSDLF